MKKLFPKSISFLLVALLIVGVFVGCGNTNTNDTTTDPNNIENSTTDNNANNSTTNKNETNNSGSEKTFTLDELSKYDGKNGQPAYIAVDGVVYDVTNNFPNGEHHGCKAGTDVTESIKNVSHGSAILSSSPVVGKLAQ